jgi:hypothetical protein
MSRFIASLFVVSATTGVAQAAFISPTGWTRPTDDTSAVNTLTTYQEWETFSSVSGPNAPTNIPETVEGPDHNPNSGTQTVFDSAAPGSGAFITGGGNIYSFGGAIDPAIIIPVYGLAGLKTQVLLQIRSQGSELSDDRVNVDIGSGPVDIETLPGYSYTELFRQALGGFGGSLVDHAWTFDLPGIPSSFRVDVDNTTSSISLDRVSVDTLSTVPEPAGLGAVALGALMALRRRRTVRG